MLLMKTYHIWNAFFMGLWCLLWHIIDLSMLYVSIPNTIILTRFRETVKSDCYLRHVRLTTWNNSAPTGSIFMKFDILSISLKSV